MSESIHAVLAYLDKVDAKAAEIARQRYGCLTPWQDEPAHYGRAVMLEGRPSCEDRAVEQMRAMLSSRPDYLEQDGERWFDAMQNARIVRAAARYYPATYRSTPESCTTRARQLFETHQPP